MEKKNLQVKTMADYAAEGKEPEVLFWVGCAGSFDDRAKKITKALEDTGRESIVLAGGVAANKLLRNKISLLKSKLNVDVLYPPLSHCTDNAAMIAYLGSMKVNEATFSLASHAKPRWPLGS